MVQAEQHRIGVPTADLAARPGSVPDGPAPAAPTTPHASTPSRASTLRPLEPPPRRVAVLRALQLGDLLCAVPALRSLRAGLPDAEITLIGLPWAASLVERFPALLDGFVAFPGHPALPEREVEPGAWEAFQEAMRDASFDLLLQLHGDGSVTNGIVSDLGAREVAGFARDPQQSPDPTRFLRYPVDRHEVHRALALVHALGMPDTGDALEFPLTDDDRAALRAIAELRPAPAGRFVVVHPGSRASDRRWTATRFAAVADALAADDLRIVLTGTADEAAITAEVAAAMDAPAIDLAGRTTLGSLAALLTEAALLVANDTGISHLASALRTPSVIVFSASDPARWAPLDRERHVAISASDPDASAAVLSAAQRQLEVGVPRVA